MKIASWCRDNAMPLIAVLAAAVTACFVPPDAAYAGYFDWKTLSCLFCVLAVVCALRSVGLFPVIAGSCCSCSEPPAAWARPWCSSRWWAPCC